jgi:hypothetical protein
MEEGDFVPWGPPESQSFTAGREAVSEQSGAWAAWVKIQPDISQPQFPIL